MFELAVSIAFAIVSVGSTLRLKTLLSETRRGV